MNWKDWFSSNKTYGYTTSDTVDYNMNRLLSGEAQQADIWKQTLYKSFTSTHQYPKEVAKYRGLVYQQMAKVWSNVFELHELPALLEHTRITVRENEQRFQYVLMLEIYLPQQKHPVNCGWAINSCDPPNHFPDLSQDIERALVKAKMLCHVR